MAPHGKNGSVKKRLPWILAGAGVTAMVVTILIVNHKPGEPLTIQRLLEARDRWARSGPAGYDLEVIVSGAQQGRHQISVRDRKVVSMTTEGRPVEASVWEHWTVEGMFRFLETELQHAERPEIGFRVKDKSQVVQYADFDSATGYPRHYWRHVMGQAVGIRWEIATFTPR